MHHDPMTLRAQVSSGAGADTRARLEAAFAKLGAARTFPRSTSRGYSRLSWGPL